MTMSNETARTSAVGTAVAEQEISFSFPIAASSELVVKTRVTSTGVETTLTETTDYSVSINGDSGGTVTLVDALAATSEVWIIRDTPMTQTLDLEHGGTFSAENLEDALDKNTKLSVNLSDKLTRSMFAPDTDPDDLDMELPSSVDRASKYLTFDSDGQPSATSSAGTAVTGGSWDVDGLRAAGVPWFDVTNSDYGATGDGETDDTEAIQAAIDASLAAGGGSLAAGAVFFPAGEYMFSNLTLYSQTTLIGHSLGDTKLTRIEGSTGTAIEDEDNAAKISIRNLQINGSGCSGTLLSLGNNTTQWGTAGCLENLWLREADTVLDIDGNIGFIKNVAASSGDSYVYDAKVKIAGEGNLIWALTHYGTTDDGIVITGTANMLVATHCEGTYTQSAIHVQGYNNTLDCVYISVRASENLPAGILIDAGKYGTLVKNLQVTMTTGSTRTTLIDDNTYSTGRSLLGEYVVAGASLTTYVIPRYTGGRSAQIFTGYEGQEGPPTEGTYWKGDWFLRREADSWEPIASLCTVAGSPGTWVDLIHRATEGFKVRNGTSAGHIDLYEGSAGGTNYVRMKPMDALSTSYTSVNGTLVLDDGANWRVTVVVKAGLIVSVTAGATIAAAGTWTADS